MDEPEAKPDDDSNLNRTPKREIGNANLFADDIVFSNTEKILFEEDLQEKTSIQKESLMYGNPEERYKPDRKLNQGGMKAIWEVDDQRTARKVAMALIQDAKIASEADIESFLYEARLTANLQHPNIIPIYDIALDESGNPYFTMKALKGESLGTIIKELRNDNPTYQERFSRTRLLGIFLKVCNAIDYAHTKGVIHLDLKPSNINVGDFGDVHVLDWGLSILVTHLHDHDGEAVNWQSMDDVSLEKDQTLTRYLDQSSKRREKNVVGGTPGYMSPEQAQGVPADIDFQTDIYMLGALLYEILTYHCPIEGNTVKEVLQKTVRGEFIPPDKKTPSLRIPPALTAITLKAMATDPSDRYSNVAALIKDLHKYQEGFATVAENPTFFTHATLLIKRHKLAVSMIMISAVIIIANLSNSYNSIKKSEKIAVDALKDLQKKNEYIAATAKRVAPDYLALMRQQESDYKFDAAEDSLDTSLAFDPDLASAWLEKGKILLSHLEFSEAWKILSGNHGHTVQQHPTAVRLAKKYNQTNLISDADIPQLVKDFKAYALPEVLPRFFYHLNKAPFNAETRLPAIEESLRILNPKVEMLNFSWNKMGAHSWIISLGDNPDLDDITPLCGLKISLLNANNIGAPDLKLLTEEGLLELRISGSRLNHLPDPDQMAQLKVIDISNTQVRNLNSLLSFSKLSTLDISGISDLVIPRQLIWCQNLKLLTVSEQFRNDPTVRALSARGVIIIYSND